MRSSIINENAENKGLSLVEAKMGKLMHRDEQELLSVWEGWHWDDNKGGWCAKSRREDVEYIRQHIMYVRVPRGGVLTRNWKSDHQDRVGRRPTKDSQESLMCARDGLRRRTRHTPDQSCMRRHRHWRR